jgi:hypothetical protein
VPLSEPVSLANASHYPMLKLTGQHFFEMYKTPYPAKNANIATRATFNIFFS